MNWWGEVNEADGINLLQKAADKGITFFDTADTYGAGYGEEIMPKALADRRKDIIIGTKFGYDIEAPREGHKERPQVWDPEFVKRACEGSLRRLQTDYIDLWQPHNPSPGPFQAEALVEVMQRVVQQGKVRHIGISTTLPDIETFIDWGVFESFQIPYSALERREERSISAAAAAGAGTIIRGGVAQGEPGAGPGKAETWTAWEKAKLDELRGEGESPTAFLLRFTISHPDMDTTIVATKNPVHLAENLQAVAAGPLPQELYAEAKRRLDRVGQQPAS